MPAIIEPELYGKPIELIKNNSEALKNFSVNGNKNLKTKASMRIEIIVAMLVVLRFIV
jgi:hypothetical protein